MLFSVGFIALALICPVLVLIAYRMGVRDGQFVSRGDVVAPISKPIKHRDTVEDVRLTTLLDNINAYDGTGRGQKEIK